MVSLFGRGFESHQLHQKRQCRKAQKLCGIVVLSNEGFHLKHKVFPRIDRIDRNVYSINK